MSGVDTLPPEGHHPRSINSTTAKCHLVRGTVPHTGSVADRSVLSFYTAEPGGPNEERLTLLASWAALESFSARR